MTDERRKAFEHACEICWSSIERKRNGGYLYEKAHDAWEVWQAACNYMESRLDSDEMVERVAKVLAGRYWAENLMSLEREEYVDAWWDQFIDEAKAALAALKGSL